MVDHDARIDVWWEIQHKWNVTTETNLRAVDARVSVIEKKVFAVSSIAAVLGALLGSFISTWFRA